MSLIVQKYGGTSVGNLERIQLVADKVIAALQHNQQVVVVLSAMTGETDRLLNLAYAITETPDSRALDALISTGEQVSIALLCILLKNRGVDAISYLGFQVPIVTDHAYGKARILRIETDKLFADLQANRVAIVAGFQGIDEKGHITTLGRGGSDTTAVALAAALKADECQIYTDVEGVYTTDPRIVSDARLLRHITFEEMLELSSLGAKVLQRRSVELAGCYRVTLRVLSTFVEGPGTLITYEEPPMENPMIAGIAFNRQEAKLTIRGVPDRPGIAFHILGAISAENIEVDMIIQNASQDGKTDFTFTVHRQDYKKSMAILQKIQTELGALEVFGDEKIAKISLVGVRMRSHAGVASRIFKVLATEGINIQLITTSEIKVSVVVDEKYGELGVRALHAEFCLPEQPWEETMQGIRMATSAGVAEGTV